MFDAVSRAEDELHGIGVWYGQEVKMMQIREKYGDTAVPVGAGNGDMAFPKREIDEIIGRYEDAMKQAGDALCRLLM